MLEPPGLNGQADLNLRRLFLPRRRLVRGILDPVPLANIVLLFFLFFLVSSSYVIRPGITVNLPTSFFSDGAPYGAFVVTLSQEGMIFFNDDRILLDGLSSAFAQAAHEQPGATLVIEADERVPYRTLVEIYNKATAAGMREVVLATRVASMETAP